MSRDLPAVPSRVEIVPAGGGRLRRWLRSPLGQAAADVAPDLLRLAGRAVASERQRQAAPDHPPAGATGVNVSEVEIDVSAPFVRRVVVRSASAWSVPPELLQPAPRRRRTGRLGLGAASLAGLAMLGLVVSRRLPLGLPSGLPGLSPRDHER
ncbi:MAG: hypothetical protein QJR03_16160 [Sphaerobacter sp.]|nr:hypothetical protein [Sphaerobacter sp.]